MNALAFTLGADPSLCQPCGGTFFNFREATPLRRLRTESESDQPRRARGGLEMQRVLGSISRGAPAELARGICAVALMGRS
eukprot:5969050-Prymnesium_polylepis.1